MRQRWDRRPSGAGTTAGQDPRGASEPIRLFRSDFLEWFTRTSLRAILLFWVPLSAALIAAGLRLGDFSAAAALALAVAAVAAWTLFEYLFHRFLFHLDPRIPGGERMSFLMHGVHHADPADASRDVMPIVASVPILAALFLAAAAIFPLAGCLVFFGVFGYAYLAYDVTHYACHQFRLRGRIGGALKRHHLAHHYVDDTRNFGVSSPLWDRLFGTVATGRRR